MNNESADLLKAISINNKWFNYLVDEYGAKGQALHEAIDSVESKIPRRAIRKLRRIATIRNKALHEDVKVAARERQKIELADQSLNDVFAPRCEQRRVARRRATRRPCAVHTQSAPNDARQIERRFSFASEAKFWLTVSAIVAIYCCWRFQWF